MLSSELLRAFAKEASDPELAMLPKVKGLRNIRKATPRLPGMSTKGQVPVNPFSGNWVKAPKTVIASLGSHVRGVGQAAGGLALLAGGAHLAKKTQQALSDPYAHQAQKEQTRGELREVRKARAGQSALNAAPGLLRGEWQRAVG